MRSRARLVSHPIHPILVALPIGMWVGSWIFDILSVYFKNWNFANTGFYLAIGGCAGAVLAAVPGVIDWISVVPGNSEGKKTGAIHGILNTLALLVFALVAFERRGFDHFASYGSLALSTVGIALVGVSGWLGGTLAYELQIGVFRRYPDGRALLERSVAAVDKPLCNVNELGDGQMMLVHLGRPGGSERVVLGRAEGKFYAFSDYCSHAGGPLCDGALVGTTVQCPWHGSQFNVITGAAVAGPAKQGLKCYETVTRGSEIYLVH